LIGREALVDAPRGGPAALHRPRGAGAIPYTAAMRASRFTRTAWPLLLLALAPFEPRAQSPATVGPTQLPNGKLLHETPGAPRATNNFPTAIALSPDGRFAVLLHGGYGAYDSAERQSLSVLDLRTNALRDFTDERLSYDARQTYFLGLAFSGDGRHLYASMASLSDPLGKRKGSTGNGIAVYGFDDGVIAAERFLPLTPRRALPAGTQRRAQFRDVTYPAGLDVAGGGQERILVAANASDEALLLDAGGNIVRRFDLSTYRRIPGSLPYAAVMTRDGTRGFVSLWNASAVADLDLVHGRVRRIIPLSPPPGRLQGGSHPTALLLSRDDARLFVALTNRDLIDVLDTQSGAVLYTVSTKLPNQQYGGSDPEYLALSPDGRTLLSANALSDSVGVFDVSHPPAGGQLRASGFIPTDWYPTVVAFAGDDVLIGSAKGRGSGPNAVALTPALAPLERRDYPYNPAMMHGSLARIPVAELNTRLADWTLQVLAANAAQGNVDRIPATSGASKIHHVIYIIKENRTYDQVFGDLSEANGDASLTMYGEAITPNQHKLAHQFGILDNFYDSGDVSGDGHVWSTTASISDYVEKTWPIAYRSKEHTYDSEGDMLGGIADQDELPDVEEPTGGYLWRNLAEHGRSYRHYGEYVVSRWCNAKAANTAPKSGPPQVEGVSCPRTVIKPGEALDKNVGDPRGGPSPYPWEIPVLAKNIAAAGELRGHFDPLYPDFAVDYPDQLRADEFLNEFGAFVAARRGGKDAMPQFILLRLPNDHTAGGAKGQPRPAASLADNDLAVGRVVDAVSHSPYWDDTAILILEDDAQDGPDHVDSHRSIALVISKYSPAGGAPPQHATPFVDHTFYTTVNMVRTIEALLEVPPMNANDARAAVMVNLFSGPGAQPAFDADYRNRDNGLLYETNTREWTLGKNLDFSRADAVDPAVLNQFLWQDRMGDRPLPAPRFTVFAPASADKPERGPAGGD
jgi:DNA-binding beta-propeller fold protein YncE